MVESPPAQAYPAFRHQLEAMLGRMAREESEAIEGSLKRAGFKFPDATQDAAGGRVKAAGRSESSGVNFSRASPLSTSPRQTGSSRIPHFDMQRITRTVVPRSKDGATHQRYLERSTVAADHHDYVTRRGKADFETHYDYVLRVTAVEATETTRLIDMLDMEEDRKLQNELSVYSNIPGGRERERSLFEAAERCERQARGGSLTVSTRHADVWLELATKTRAPGWVRAAALKLKKERDGLQKKAAKSNRTSWDCEVAICSVDLEEAYDRLSWCDTEPLLSAKTRPNWQPGPSGRIQTRFVAELPNSCTVRERRQILENFGNLLSDAGWMVVGAVHRPDRHNDKRNFHIHVDAYDRPSRWLEDHGCWDFEYSVKARNGKRTFPYRQNKVASVARDVPRAGQKAMGCRAAGARIVSDLRDRYIEIVNEVIAERGVAKPYQSGTFKDAGIRLTPLRHLGNKACALEKKGIVTEVGSLNARTIYDDRLSAVLLQADYDRMENGFRLIEQRGSDASTEHLSAGDRWLALANEAVARDTQMRVFEIVEDMARSRADAVLRAGIADRETLRAADSWLADIHDIAPDTAARDFERENVDRLRLAADEAWREFASFNTPPRCSYIAPPGRTKDTFEPIDDRWLDDTTHRLISWIETHAHDANSLIFLEHGFTIGHKAPPSIHRLCTLLGDTALVQEALGKARASRSTHNASRSAGAVAPPASHAKSPSSRVSVQPRENHVHKPEQKARAALPRVGMTCGTPTMPRFAVAPKPNRYSQANTAGNSLASNAPMLATSTISGLSRLSDLPSLSALNDNRLSSATGMAGQRPEQKIVVSSGAAQQVGAATTNGTETSSVDVGAKIEAKRLENGSTSPTPTPTAVSNIASSRHETDKAKRASFSAVRDLIRNHVPRHTSSTQHRTSIARVPANAVEPDVDRIEATIDHQSSIKRSKQQLPNTTGSQSEVAAGRGGSKDPSPSEHARHVAVGNGVDKVIEELRKIEWPLPVRHRRDENEGTGQAYFILVISNTESAAHADTLIRAKAFESDTAMQSFLGGEFERAIAAIRRLLLELPLEGSVRRTLAHWPEAVHLLPFVKTGEGSKTFEMLYAMVTLERAGGINSPEKPGKGVGWEGL